MNWIVVVVAVMAALVLIRLCGWLMTGIAHEATTWCETCGIAISEGWVIYRVMPSTGDPPDRGGAAAYRSTGARGTDRPTGAQSRGALETR